MDAHPEERGGGMKYYKIATSYIVMGSAKVVVFKTRFKFIRDLVFVFFRFIYKNKKFVFKSINEVEE